MYTYTESNLVGNLSAPTTSTATTWTGTVKDRITGVQRDPQTTTVLWVIDKGSSTNPNPNYEIVYGEPSSTGGVTTWSNGVRGLAFYGSSLTSVTANKKSHTSNAEIGPVDVHFLFNLLTDQVSGVAEGTQTLTLHVFATEAARDASIASPTNGMICLVTATQTLYFRVNGKWYGSSCPVYATTTARDAAITSPQNGMSCYVTADLVFYDYQGGSWQTRANGATPAASTVVAGKVYIDTADAGPTVPSMSSTRILDATSQSATGQIKIANNTTGSRSATMSLHGDDTYISGGDIIQRANTGVNAATTWTHRGTGELKLYLQEAASLYVAGGTMKLDADVVRAFVAGETLVAGNWVYVKSSDGKVYKTQNTTVEKASFVGVIITGGNANDTVFVQQAGIYITSGLTAGSLYWIDSTTGAITAGAPAQNSVSTVPYQVGYALVSNALLIRPKRIQRGIPFSGSRTAVSGSGTQTVTIGGATSYNIGRVEIASSMVSPSFCHGWYDASSASQYYCYVGASASASGSGFGVALADGGGSWTGSCGVNTNDLTITWTKTSSPGTANFAGVAYELL